MDFLAKKLEERAQAGNLRSLFVASRLVDFASNDYLGFAARLSAQAGKAHEGQAGSTGSRLISGNSHEAEELEQYLAQFHEAAAGLLFNSGYDANIGLFSSIGGQGDFYVSDELIHASMIDGIRLSKAQRLKFRHNDLEDLEKKLKHCRQAGKGQIFLAIESVYSMDGDIAPLLDILALATQYEAYVIMDEAHATGIIGRRGEGLAQSLQVAQHPQILARVHTFGKALGTHGAVVLGSDTLRSYLINFARSFIYTTALPTASLAYIRLAYQCLQSPYFEQARQQLSANIAYYQTQAAALPYPVLASPTAIQGIIIGENKRAKAAQIRLQEAGIYAKAILSPTVPQGTERLRICLHSFNTPEEIALLLQKI